MDETEPINVMLSKISVGVSIVELVCLEVAADAGGCFVSSVVLPGKIGKDVESIGFISVTLGTIIDSDTSVLGYVGL